MAYLIFCESQPMDGVDFNSALSKRRLADY